MFFAFISCKNDQVLPGSIDSKSGYAIILSYEEETRSSFSSLSGTADTKNENMPLQQEVNCSRQKVQIGIAEDGSSVMETTRMKPEHFGKSVGYIHPPQEDEVNSMVFRNGQVTMYNAAGKVVGQERSEMPSYKELITQVRQNKNSLTRRIYGDFLKQQKLQCNENSNLKVKEDGDITITESIVGPEDGFDPAMDGFKVSSYFETSTGLLLGSAILDNTGVTVYRSVMTYNADENNPLPEFSHEESFGTSESGEEYMITTLRYTENVEIVID